MAMRRDLPVWCCLLLGLVLAACNSKQQADEAWVDSVLQAIDTIPDERLDYSVDEAPLSNAVDGNFNDFFYAFLNNRKFQAERVAWPLAVCDVQGNERTKIRRSRELNDLLLNTPTDYFVLFLDNISQLEDDSYIESDAVSVHLINLDESSVNRCAYERQEGHWMMTGVTEESFDVHPMGHFLTFYNHFATDSIFQIAHVAQPLHISVPDEESETDYIEGTIDADQFPLFSPELPMGRMMVVDYGQLSSNARRLVMVKCGMGNGMMDILTFEREGSDWQLVGLEE